MIRSTPVVVTLIAALAADAVAAQAIANSANTLRLAPGSSPPPAAIGEVAWLAGYWRGAGLGGVSEELWAQPTGDRMYGTYALLKEGAVVFSEAMMLIEHEGSLVLRVKHFTPEFIGWEEKDGYVSFPLVRLGENEAYFSGLTFRRAGPVLTIHLVLSSEGVRTEHEFRLERVPL